MYYKYPNKFRFRTKVLAVIDDFVVLDKTYFYAESGGQESDTGAMKDMKVTHVDKVGNIVLHKVEGTMQAKVGKLITCTIDEHRRRRLQRHHTATHLVNGAARSVLGSHVWQTGAHKAEDGARLDITHYADLTPEELEKIELLANETVLAGIKVQSSFQERTVAEKRYGFRLYQGGAVPGKDLRVVRIGDFDVEACGGIHCKNTLEVGMIKILSTKRIQDGVVRLEFTAGLASVEKVRRQSNEVASASSALMVSPEELGSAVIKLINESRLLRKELDSIKKGMVGETVEDLLKRAERVNGVTIVRHIQSEDMKHLVSLAKEMIASPRTIVVLASDLGGAKMVVARSDDLKVNCRPLIADAMLLVGGSGGGKSDFAQGGGPSADRLEEALDDVVTAIRAAVEKE
jgi:alanyl-tRNA synthetase